MVEGIRVHHIFVEEVLDGRAVIMKGLVLPMDDHGVDTPEGAISYEGAHFTPDKVDEVVFPLPKVMEEGRQIADDLGVPLRFKPFKRETTSSEA